MSARLVVLVPPSQGMAMGGRRRIGHGRFDDALAHERQVVARALGAFVSGATPKELEATFGARGALLERAVAAARVFVEGGAPVLPAWRRYQGVVWTYLRPAALTPGSRRRILVPSG
ncbi:MAG TPA: hypothetical protein VMF33_02745, partial [Acidimicrobiales bacterium]|nr:hypothetical protein [Acidimicrobiales bacterium]